MIDRRGFLLSSAAAVAAACARAGGPSLTSAAPRLPIGFSTLGSPRWSWTRILDVAVANGYRAIELRGLEEDIDLTKRPEFAGARLAATRRELADRGLSIISLGASAWMHEADPATQAVQLDEGRRYIDLAAALRAPYVRVFGDRFVAGESPQTTRLRIGRALRELGDHARGRGVTVLLESHGDFTDSENLADVLGHAGETSVGLLWDAHHTFVSGKEDPEVTVSRLGKWIRHTHLKDSVAAAGGRRYVLTGTGEVPVRRQIEALARAGYTGYYSFEWEKRWHPDIEEPEVAIPHFARVAAGWLRDAGVAPR